MNEFLVIDFGASRIKAAIANTNSDTFSQFKDFSSFPNITSIKGHFEILPSEVHNKFLEICNFYSSLSSIKGIVICSQMHGFLALDKNSKPISNYISWQDERSLENIDVDESTFGLLLHNLGLKFKQITGMKPRPSLPFFNAIHWAKKQSMKKAHLIGLSDWLAMVSDQSCGLSHSTMLAGLGFYDIYQKHISEELVDIAKQFSGCKFSFNKPASHNQVAGYWSDKEVNIPIYVGVGDHQCAVLGAGNLPKKTISVNIGTGSQVSVIDIKPKSDEVEFRPYFNDSILSTITHIPAGRVLEYYLSKIINVNIEEIWAKIKDIKIDEIKKSNQEINLAIFPGAWNYNQEKNSTDFLSKKLSLKSYLAALIKALAEQYAKAVGFIDPKNQIKIIVLSGGVPNRIPQLKVLTQDFTSRKVESIVDIDETLLGLAKLAKDIK